MDELRRTQRLQVGNNLDLKKYFNSRLACFSALWEVRSENDLLGVTVLLFYFFHIKYCNLEGMWIVLFGVRTLLRLCWGDKRPPANFHTF